MPSNAMNTPARNQPAPSREISTRRCGSRPRLRDASAYRSASWCCTWRMRETCGASCTGGPPSITDEIASSASEIAARSGSSEKGCRHVHVLAPLGTNQAQPRPPRSILEGKQRGQELLHLHAGVRPEHVDRNSACFRVTNRLRPLPEVILQGEDDIRLARVAHDGRRYPQDFDGVLQSIATYPERVDAERTRVRAAPFQRCRQWPGGARSRWAIRVSAVLARHESGVHARIARRPASRAPARSRAPVRFQLALRR